MTTVLIVDDHTLMRDGLRRLLEGYPDLKVVGEACEGREAVRLIKQLQPDVVLLDLSLPGLDGLDVTKRVVAEGGASRILMLTMHANEEYAVRALRAGALGFMVKDDPSDDVVDAVRKVAAGETYLSPVLSQRLPQRFTRGREAPSSLNLLSDRELQVLKKFAEGHTTSMIAQELHLSVKTIDTHRARLLEKLGLHTTVDLIRFALRNRLIEDLW